MRYYIATKLENHAAHNALRDKLQAAGHECTYDWTTHGPVYKLGLQVIEQTAQLEHEGVINADTVIMLWPGGRGTHVELGMAIALAKRVIIVTDVSGHHEPSPETCAFYHHPQVELVSSIDQLLASITP